MGALPPAVYILIDGLDEASEGVSNTGYVSVSETEGSHANRVLSLLSGALATLPRCVRFVLTTESKLYVRSALKARFWSFVLFCFVCF